MLSKSGGTDTNTETETEAEKYIEIIDTSNDYRIQLEDFLQSHKLEEKNFEIDKRLVHIKCICVTSVGKCSFFGGFDGSIL